MVTKSYQWLLLAILALLPAYLVRFSVFGIPTTVLELAIYLAVIITLWLITQKQLELVVPDVRWIHPIALFVLSGILGVLVSPHKMVALGQFKGFIVDPLLFAWVVLIALHSKIITRDQVINSLMIGGSIISIATLLFPFSHDGRALSVFALDPTANPNFLALFLVPIAAFTLAQLTDLQKQQFILWPALLLNFIAIVLSRSRGGILGLTLGILFVLLTRFKKNLWGRVGIVVIVMLVVTGIYRSLPNLAATPNSGRIASSNNIRYEIWKTTREMLASPKPIFVGFGLGNYQQTFTEFTKDRVNYPEFIAPEALTPHNLVLALWANGGLLMVMSFIWLIVVAFKKRGGLAAQSALIALLGHGLVDTPYFKNDLSVLFWIIIVLIMISGKYDTA